MPSLLTNHSALKPSLTAAFDAGQARTLLDALVTYECPSLTSRRRRSSDLPQPHASPVDSAVHVAPATVGYDPIVWHEAAGCNVIDAAGNCFVDLTAGFGAAAIGHRHPAVVNAIQQQAATLCHALGDVHPSDVKIKAIERIANLAPWPETKVILGLSGADAVEAALKTAALATERAGVIAFEGGYHGLSHGTLAVCGYKESFRAPFRKQLGEWVYFAPYPSANEPYTYEASLRAVDALFDAHKGEIGAVLIEPIQGRGGLRIPPVGFLKALRDRARGRGALLIMDEILTGLGRTGSHLRCIAEHVVPDIICLGKALGGGLPISACLAPGKIMAAWGDPSSEALHTSTFLGNPLSCAAAIATLDVLASEHLAERARICGAQYLSELNTMLEGSPKARSAIFETRGVGMMLAIDFADRTRAAHVLHAVLRAGYITLFAGAAGRTLSLTPPLTLPPELFRGFCRALVRALETSA